MTRLYTGKDVETDGWTTVYASDCDVTKRYTPAPPAKKPPLTQIDGRGKEEADTSGGDTE